VGVFYVWRLTARPFYDISVDNRGRVAVYASIDLYIPVFWFPAQIDLHLPEELQVGQLDLIPCREDEAFVLSYFVTK
jgi:hypothetical protein